MAPIEYRLYGASEAFYIKQDGLNLHMTNVYVVGSRGSSKYLLTVILRSQNFCVGGCLGDAVNGIIARHVNGLDYFK